MTGPAIAQKDDPVIGDPPTYPRPWRVKRVPKTTITTPRGIPTARLT
jgi:hypothetical protein